MDFTALHRLLGLPPSPVTNELVDEAVSQRLAETHDLDWKSKLPPAKDIGKTDFPKDIAAMANAGGGTIVYGVNESNKEATSRCDVGALTEPYERALRSIAVSGIRPPVFNLGIHKLGDEGNRCVVVVVPPSVDGPHLIYRDDYFGAPIRNDADTVWMKEQQLESMYRARFDQRRHADEALANLYDEIGFGRDTDKRAWLIAVAHPRLPALQRGRLSREEAGDLFSLIGNTCPNYTDPRHAVHPLEATALSNPRPGLRRWIAPFASRHPDNSWRASDATIHYDGSVTLATGIGGHRARTTGTWNPGGLIDSTAIESAVVDLACMAHAVGNYVGCAQYEVRIGIEWSGPGQILIQTVDGLGRPFKDNSILLPRYVPVSITLDVNVDDDSFFDQITELAQDCVNQGGITNLHALRKPSENNPPVYFQTVI
ncbi:ATP-binding protein [Nocardia cyriacigeorgica]|uniref:AlbA family DNA-binding domain-containing protein n=1 Tax=Nocardia cyriacigeorgica TaxID=135487 RepID=UPI00189351E0|nr:ATP-binding protein [Nocardia cyriacigeorgica]MBF6515237.1 ATP-binding protein [Nocardia cyriacigeorgica]